MVTKRGTYKRDYRVEGVLTEMPKFERKVIVDFCQDQARQDAKTLGIDYDSWLWRYEQWYEGKVKGKQVRSRKAFEGGKPYSIITWKAVI